MTSGEDTSRTSVKTYVPQYQKSAWVDHADELDMSLSEFVSTMVQAGRKGFEGEASGEASSERNPGGEGLEDRVVAQLRSGPLSWDELLESLSGDLESRLDDALTELQDDNRLRYSGRDGGYVLRDE